MTSYRRGLLYGAAAYFMWGLFPLYWPLLEPAGPLEILANRVVWSLAVVLVIAGALHRWTAIRAVVTDRRRMLLLSGAAVVLTVNWGTYIWAVNAHHVVETSLGYFINPLVSIALGVLVLRERLTRAQWVALTLAVLAVGVLTADYGRLPWIALVLAFSFGTYGLLKKLAGVPGVDSLAVETSVLAPVALGFLVWLQAAGHATFGHAGTGQALLLAGSGLVTALPLLAFGAAVTRIPLTMVGVLQYLAPVLQFAIGVGIRHEPLTTVGLLGFALVWVALMIFTLDGVVLQRRSVRARPEVEPVV